MNPKNTREAQNRNGRPDPNFDSQLPTGGVKTLAIPITDIFSPVAVPANRVPMPFSSMIAVMVIAMNPSREMPAIKTAAEIKKPLVNPKRPVPIPISNAAAIRTWRRLPTRSESRAMGIVKIMLTA
jgi:hypothetical protein